jgi:hypothetical protein
MPDPADRRAAERLAVTSEASCTFAARLIEDLGPVKLVNVSLEGVGLLTSRRIEPGTKLAITLANAAKGFSKTVVVQVAHSTPQLGSHLIGGTFEVPLTYAEMSVLVLSQASPFRPTTPR